MGDLSTNFSRHEFACSCCGRGDPRMDLVDACQELRNIIGPIKVNCGYRCPGHNREIGGARGSYHTTNMAADLCSLADLTPVQMYEAARQVTTFNHGGIGIYQWGIHVDIRGRMARWAKVGEDYTDVRVGLELFK